MSNTPSAAKHTIENPFCLHKTFLHRNLRGSYYFECDPKITTGIKLVSHHIAVELQTESDKWKTDSEIQFRNWQLAEEQCKRYKVAYEESEKQLEEQKQLTASLSEALKEADKQLYELMEYCVNNRYIDPEDESDGVVQFNNCREKTISVIAKCNESK